MKKHTNYFFAVLVFGLMFSCTEKKAVSTIDETLQAKVEEILGSELSACQADSGLVIVMSVKTGEIKAQAKMLKDFSQGKFIKLPDNRLKVKGEPGPVLIPITVLAGMEEVSVGLDFEIDAENGMYVANGRTIYDQEVFDKGGYGKITLGQSVTLPSFIGTVKFLELAFSANVDIFEYRMQMMSFGLPQDSNVFKGVPVFSSKLNAFSLGYYCKTTPYQVLTAFNAIANNGRIVAPVTETSDTTVISEVMCSNNNIKAMNELLISNGAKLMPDVPGLALMKGFSSVKNTYIRELKLSMCGYLPAENPEYSIMMVIFRTESPNLQPEIGSGKINESGMKVFKTVATALN